MVKDREIDRCRAKLERSLASPDLQSREAVKNLLRDQLQGCSETVVHRRVNEISNVLDMFRSASSLGKHSAWKLKADGRDFRVMYRPDPDGPFHSLLLEGCIDAPLDECLCISWETQLFRKWWPQSAVPPFKLTHTERLLIPRVGEEVAFMRMKVPWPMTSREAVVHFLKFDYFKEDMIVVVINSIADSEEVEEETHGFKRECIPEAKDAVRIDYVGGFVIQKVSSNRSFFRTIAKMDMKLDVVPASMINFISRQLVGQGFKLYQKAVISLARKRDDDYVKELGDSMYARIRMALYDDGNGRDDREEEYSDCISSSIEEHEEHDGEEHDEETVATY